MERRDSIAVNDILTSVVYHFVTSILTSDKYMVEFTAVRKMSIAKIVDLVLVAITNKTQALTVKDCCDILSGQYDDNFNTSTCIVYHTKKTQRSAGGKYHKHCGKSLQDFAVCNTCRNIPEGIKMLEQINANRFEAISYRQAKTKLRIIFAKSKIKQYKIDHFYTKGKLFVKADYMGDHNIYYSPELYIHIRRELIGDVYKNITVGEQRGVGPPALISYKTIVTLKDLDITVDINTLSAKCLELVNMRSCI